MEKVLNHPEIVSYIKTFLFLSKEKYLRRQHERIVHEIERECMYSSKEIMITEQYSYYDDYQQFEKVFMENIDERCRHLYGYNTVFDITIESTISSFMSTRRGRFTMMIVDMDIFITNESVMTKRVSILPWSMNSNDIIIYSELSIAYNDVYMIVSQELQYMWSLVFHSDIHEHLDMLRHNIERRCQIYDFDIFYETIAPGYFDLNVEIYDDSKLIRIVKKSIYCEEKNSL